MLWFFGLGTIPHFGYIHKKFASYPHLCPLIHRNVIRLLT
uniref:Uncharacterized protein n=1 Tax=Arundo donax TaxID=35708 RepID=A0A0A9SXT3_ARUDO